jgi:hypothetical protein
MHLNLLMRRCLLSVIPDLHSCWSFGVPAAVDCLSEFVLVGAVAPQAAVDCVTKCVSTRRGRRIPIKNALASGILLMELGRPRHGGFRMKIMLA